MKNQNTVEFRYIPMKQNYPKTYSLSTNPFDDFEKEDSEKSSSEITYRIYAGNSNDSNVKYNSYYNVSILGNLPELSMGAEYDVVAIEEEKNGEPQYKVISIKRKRPMNNEGVRLFLSEILTPTQVDQVMLHYPNIIDIVSEGKIDTIDVTKLYGIGNYIIKVIERKILENFKFAEIIAEFEGMLNFEILKKLSEKYTSIEEIKQEIKNNPYECLTNLSKVGFKIADKTIINFDKQCKKKHKNGEKPPILFDYDISTSKQRTNACIEYILNENENEGHTKMVTQDLIKEVKNLAPECFGNVVDVLKNKDKYVLKTPYISRKITYDTEIYIAETLRFALDKKNNINWNFDISKYKNDFNLTEEQFSIIKNVCENNISVLNGAGGTGKSFTIKAVLQMLKDNNVYDYLLSAPTGKAAKVIKHYTNENAMTVHRMLGARGSNIFDFNETNKLHAQIVFIDESSMLDIFLMKHLLEAIDFIHTKLVFIGDSAQLPSVSCGNVFHDILESNIPKTTLTRVFRYGIGGISTVATNTRLMKETIKDSETQTILGDDKAYVYFNISQDKIVKNVLTLYKKLLETNSPENISILTSYNKGEYGTVVLNNYLQAIANPKSKNKEEGFIKVVDTKYYIDDIVMQNVNNYKAIKFVDNNVDASLRYKYTTFISNGETGKIIDMDFQRQVVVIKFDDDTVVYTTKQLFDCRLSYICSIHKSQGSQNNIVILLTPKAHTYMLNSNLIYVGVTRATDRVYHFGELETFNRAVKIKENFERMTWLKELLKEF